MYRKRILSLILAVSIPASVIGITVNKTAFATEINTDASGLNNEQLLEELKAAVNNYKEKFGPETPENTIKDEDYKKAVSILEENNSSYTKEEVIKLIETLMSKMNEIKPETDPASPSDDKENSQSDAKTEEVPEETPHKPHAKADEYLVKEDFGRVLISYKEASENLKKPVVRLTGTCLMKPRTCLIPLWKILRILNTV